MSETLEKPPVAAGDVERRILAALESMAHGTEFSSVPTTDGRFLRQMTEAVGAKRVVGQTDIRVFGLRSRSRRRADICGHMRLIRRGRKWRVTIIERRAFRI